ncbi:MAG: hypothetical protein LUI13_00625 [Lachnospiraceae bacterium]|nr:hypothetical protein [Lachnospiraceae bacterium]
MGKYKRFYREKFLFFNAAQNRNLQTDILIFYYSDIFRSYLRVRKSADVGSFTTSFHNSRLAAPTRCQALPHFKEFPKIINFQHYIYLLRGNKESNAQ